MEILGLNTSTGTTLSTSAAGMGAQVLGFDSGKSDGRYIQDEMGMRVGDPYQQGYFSNLLFTGLENAPTTLPSTGYTIMRAQNTITRGGKILKGNTEGFHNRYTTNRSPLRYGSEEIFRVSGKGPARMRQGMGSAAWDVIKDRGKDRSRIKEAWDSRKAGHTAGYSPFQLSEMTQKGMELMHENRRSTIVSRAQADMSKLDEVVGKKWSKDAKEAFREFNKNTPRPTRSGSGPSDVRKYIDETLGYVDDMDKAIDSKNSSVKNWVQKRLDKGFQRLEDKGLIKVSDDGKLERVFGKGTMAHMGAGSKVARMGTLSAETAANMNKTLGVVKGMNAGVSADIMKAGMTGRQAGATYMMESASGTIGSRVQGYAAGAMFGEKAVTIGTNKTAQASAAKAVEHLALGGLKRNAEGKVVTMAGERAGLKVTAMAAKKAYTTAAAQAGKRAGVGAAAKVLGVRAAGFATAAIPFVNIAMGAWMIYDLAKLGTQLVKEAIIKPVTNLVKDGYKSMKGQIDKAPMGMGFKDNSIAMTSRQRGVMAISNSRLNARSVLGSEAGAMAQHFG